MRIISWSTLLLVCSLSLTWGGGYWLWQQTAIWQQQQHKTELSLQVERADALLSQWQQNYQLHLQYLQHELESITPLNTDSPLLDPWGELSDKIQHTLWPDPLLAYGWLDQDGKALRLSQPKASAWLAQSKLPELELDRTHAQFGTPQIYPSTWLIPVYLQFNQGHLVLWISLEPLQRQLQALLQRTPDASWLLVGVDGYLQSPSNVQSLLQDKLVPKQLGEEKPLRFALKRPPVPLESALQTFDSTAAWPETALMHAMRNSSRGFLPNYATNYLGRPALSAWQWHDQWKAYLVVEQDGVKLIAEQKKRQRWLLMALVGSSTLLMGVFFLLRRSVSRQQQLQQQAILEHELPTVELDELSEVLAQVEAQQLERLPQASQAHTLLQAWLAPNLPSPTLRQMTQTWLARHPTHQGPQPLYALAPRVPLFRLVQRVKQQHAHAELLLDIDAGVSEWLLIPWGTLALILEFLLSNALSRSHTKRVQLHIEIVEPQRLRFDIADDGALLSDEQWHDLLHPATPSSSDDVVHFQQVRDWVSALQGQLVGYCAMGNRLSLTIPVQALPSTHVDARLPSVDGSAMLLCPAGDAQLMYSHMLIQAGLTLVPLNDAEQFVRWCAAPQHQQLDYLVLDEGFVSQDPALVEKIAMVVQRYFPAAELLLFVDDATTWLEQQSKLQLLLLEKPILSDTLVMALQRKVAGALQPWMRRVWLYHSDSVQYWYQEQTLTNLGYAVSPVANWPELPALSDDEVLLLPLAERVMLSECVDEKRVIWSCPQQELVSDTVANRQVWAVELGAVELSHLLYQVFNRER